MDGLPRWLAHPQIINNSTNVNDSFIDDTGDESELFDALGIEGLFPFQRVVRERLNGVNEEGWRDLCVSAPTGSGKTLAYVLPIVEGLKGRTVSRLRALIVVPTRDLTGQVEDTFRAVSEACGSVGGDPLCSGVDYLVTTPGRLITILPDLDLRELKYLVVDEADRLLDQSFQEWLPQLLDRLSSMSCDKLEAFDSSAWCNGTEGEQVKKLLFSATLTRNPAKIAPLNLYRPLYLSVRSDFTDNFGENDILVTPEGLKEIVVVFGGAEEMKPAVLAELLTSANTNISANTDISANTTISDNTDTSSPNSSSSSSPLSLPLLCFTKSLASSQRLCKLLANLCPTLRCASFHGNLSDPDRARTLSAFSAGQIDVLVGSDAMARGLDLKSVKCVVNYDAPGFAATYVHRVGRTARAGQSGLAVTLLPSTQMRSFKKMLHSALNKTLIDFSQNSTDPRELKHNQVGKIEIDENFINEKWRNNLIESLKSKVQNKSNKE